MACGCARCAGCALRWSAGVRDGRLRTAHGDVWDGSTRPKTYYTYYYSQHSTHCLVTRNTSGNTRGTEAAATRGRRANHTLRTRTVSSDVIEGSGPTAQSRESPILVVACTCSPGKVGAMVGAIEGASLAWSTASGRLRPLTSQWRLCLLPASPSPNLRLRPPKTRGGRTGRRPMQRAMLRASTATRGASPALRRA